MNELIQELRNQDWPKIIRELISYAAMRMKVWGLLKGKALKGHEAKDIAFKAIQAVFDGEWQWDPQKGELLPYLKYHVVKGLVANLAKSHEVAHSVRPKDGENIPEPLDDFNHEDELNASMVIDQIKDSIKNDQVALMLVDGLSNGLKRGEICESNNISLDEYDNALRRLRTKLVQLEKKKLLTVEYGRTKQK
jgi:hypothetical protein